MNQKLAQLGIPPEKQTASYFDQMLPEAFTINGITCKRHIYSYEKILPSRKLSPLLVPNRQPGETMIHYPDAKLIVRAKTEWEAKARMIIKLVDLEFVRL
jgi:hypothetical protein